MKKRFQGLQSLERQGEALSPDQFDAVMAQYDSTQPMPPPRQDRTPKRLRSPGSLEGA